MAKTLLTAMVSCLFILTAASASASPVGVSIDPAIQTGSLYSSMKFRMTIENNQDHEDIFQMVLSGPHLEWFMPAFIAKSIPAHSSESFDLVFYPTGSESGAFEFTATAASARSPEVKSSVNLGIIIQSGLVVKSFEPVASGSSVSFSLVVSTPEEKTVAGRFLLKDSARRVVSSLPFTSTASGEREIKSTAKSVLSGTYTAAFEIAGAESDSKSTVTIQPVRHVMQAVQENEGWFEKHVIVSVTNDGNYIERNYAVTQELKADPMTGLMTKPADNCVQQEGGMACTYIITEIRPGATSYVTYTVSYWPALYGYLLLVILTIGLVIYSFLRVTTPQIAKRYSPKGAKKHNISIHLKNPFFHTLGEVVVKDTVSPLAQVLHDEIESTRPVVIKNEDGSTGLIWKLGEMKPREERILQYKVRSLAKGALRLPGAQIKFITGKNDRKIKLISNGITLH